MRGRSDATLNPGGVRIGTSEIYQQVEDIDFITEGLVVGQDYNDDVRIVLFITTKNNEELNEEKKKFIKDLSILDYFYIEEVLKVVESQGLSVDVRHIMLVADIMCQNGSVKGITRFGVVSEKSSVLARASFETPLKHLITASVEGEVDHLRSVVENVMINQPIPLGTGLPGLITKLK